MEHGALQQPGRTPLVRRNGAPTFSSITSVLGDALVNPPAVRSGRMAVALRAVGFLKGSVLLLIGLVFGLELIARRDLYGLRVTGDAPSYIGLLYQLAQHPFSSVNAYLPGVDTSHATPDLQLAALVWRIGHGTGTADPVAAYRLLAILGLLSTALLLHSCFLWVRSHAGSTAGWISIPVVLTLFGPAHVIWAGDISLHGLLYGSFYSQTLGLALALYTLTALEHSSRPRLLALTVPLMAATMTVHPLTGLLLAGLVSVRAAIVALGRRPGWWLATPTILGGFILGSLWPGYRLASALSTGGAGGTTLVVGFALLPVFVAILDRDLRAIPGILCDALPARVTERNVSAFALLGGAGLLALVGWEAAMLWGSAGNAWPRLNIYWVDHLGRWPLMLAGGLVGVVGLYELARRGRPLPLVWFSSFYVIGAVGALGVQLPLWYRLVLLCQPPLALGVALVAANPARRVARVAVAATVGLGLAVSVYTFAGLSPRTTYYGGGWIADAYLLGKTIPAGSGGVISDPATSYYIPAATGRHVLTVSMAHVGSPAESLRAEAGYERLRSFYTVGDGWWSTLRTLWNDGYRYVVVSHTLSLKPPSLRAFSDAPPALESPADRQALGRYFWALNRVGTPLLDSPEYVVYRLDRDKIW